MDTTASTSGDATLFALETLLAFYAEAGVDWVLDETPRDHFTAVATPPEPYSLGTPRPPNMVASERGAAPQPGNAARTQSRPAAAPAAPAASSSAPAAPAISRDLASSADELAQQARHLASSAASLEALQAAMEQFDGCALKRTASQLVFGGGAATAAIMLIGDAPGADEDRLGKPFAGRSGLLLDRILAAVGLDRSNVYIANTVPWRPPGNRTPTPQEAAICRPFIDRQIALVAPSILVCLGGPPSQSILGVRESISRLRGRWSTCTIEGRDIKTMPTLHPDYLLRSPLQKRLAWRDFRAVRAALDAG